MNVKRTNKKSYSNHGGRWGSTTLETFIEGGSRLTSPRNSVSLVVFYSGTRVANIPQAAKTKFSTRWDFKLWPKTAAQHGLVLVGWGPHMPSDPTSQWIDKRTGGLTRDHWMHLVWRIPVRWRNNPHNKTPEGELELELVTLEAFIADHPGTWFLSL